LIDTLYNTQRVIKIARNEAAIEEVLKQPESEEDAKISSQTYLESSGIKQITPAELRKLLDLEAELILIDVREGIHGSGIAYDKATAIPYSHLAAYADELMEEKMIVVYCQSGRTSTMAATLLADYSLPHVYNLAGGLNEWAKIENEKIV
jgi:rhodanese-related sulfurtransferase